MAGPDRCSCGSVRVTSSIARSGITQPTRLWYAAVADASSRPLNGVTASCGRIGVPTAPNDTPTEWPTSAIVTASTRPKPAATRNGAASATDVPKPAAPSTNSTKNQATKSARILGSGDSRPIALRSTSNAPVRCCSSWMHNAGKMIHRIVAAMNTASASAPPVAATGPSSGSTSRPYPNASHAIGSVNARPAAPARAADQRAPSIATRITTIGRPASDACSQAATGYATMSDVTSWSAPSPVSNARTFERVVSAMFCIASSVKNP